jgi:ATP-dependent DNA ligase
VKSLWIVSGQIVEVIKKIKTILKKYLTDLLRSLKRHSPFDDPDFIFELKLDGFRALAVIEYGRAQLLSRNGHPFASFSALAESISDSLANIRAVIDGGICFLDRRGRPQFKNLLFRRGNPCFFAFDLLCAAVEPALPS